MKIAARRLAAVDSRWRLGRAAAAVACLAALGMEAAVGQTRTSRPPPAVRRSRPPDGAWDRATADTFLPDAFSTLEGPRPAFAAGSAGQPATAADAPATVAFKWSTLVSADTLTDEVKDAKAALEAACRKPGDFKGGGFETARAGFGTLAVAFGVIAAYDGDVRWKKDAALARDLFARARSACGDGSDRSYAEARARLADLAAMLDGNAPTGGADRSTDFRWSEAAGRPALMVRLQQSLEALRQASGSPSDFGRRRDAVLHAVEIVAVIGQIIQQPDFPDHDDDTYRSHSSTMRDAAVEARAACERDDYEAARAAVGRIEKACVDCHGDYRG